MIQLIWLDSIFFYECVICAFRERLIGRLEQSKANSITNFYQISQYVYLNITTSVDFTIVFFSLVIQSLQWSINVSYSS